MNILSLVLFYKQGTQSQINKKFHPFLLPRGLITNVGTQSVQELFFVIGAFVELFTVMI